MDLSFLKAIRTRREITLKELSSLTGISPTMIYKIENGDPSVKIKDVIAICKIFDHDIVVKDKINRHREEHSLINQ